MANEKKSRRAFRPEPDAKLKAKPTTDGAVPLSADAAPRYRKPQKGDGPAVRRGKPKEESTPPRRPRASSKEVPTPDLPDMKPPRARRTTAGSKSAGSTSGGTTGGGTPGGPEGGSGTPPSGPMGSAAAAEQYVRLRIRARGDQLSVLDSRLVDGPLAQTTSFSGSNAYEVTVGERLVHAGELPDPGVQRSFVAPGATAEQGTHHVTERDVFEFYARIPAQEVTREALPQLAVRIHRVKGEARADTVTDQPLAAQFSRQMRPLAELRGLPESVLPEEIDRRGGRTPSA